jgi:dTMP kinase
LPVAPLFITFEGLDGAGKTTQIRSVERFLRRGAHRKVRVVREPGDTRWGERFRELVLNDEEMTALAEASLFAAARAELVETVIRPALAAGFDVVCDRHVDSSIAYQAYGRGIDESALAAWNAYIVGDLVPHRTYYLALAAEDSSFRLARQLRLFDEDKDERGPPDRLESESLAFRLRVQQGYEELAGRFPERIKRVRASLPAQTIRAIIRDDLRELIALDAQPSLIPA